MGETCRFRSLPGLIIAAEVTQRLAQAYAYILELARADNHDEEENQSKESTLDATSGTGETTGALEQKSSGDNPFRVASAEDNSPDPTVGAYEGVYTK